MIVMVGERANGTEPKGQSGLQERLAAKAFTNGASRKFLEQLGWSWNHALNLLPAMPTQFATWGKGDREHARNVAFNLYAACPVGTIFVLCGARVASSFGLSYEIGPATAFDGARCVVIPHPSPKNRAWNKAETREYVKKLARHYVMKSCGCACHKPQRGETLHAHLTPCCRYSTEKLG